MEFKNFNINVDGKQYDLQTPATKYYADFKFSVFQEGYLLVTIIPEMQNNEQLRWLTCCDFNSNIINLQQIKAIGKAIEKYYLNDQPGSAISFIYTIPETITKRQTKKVF